MDGRLRLYRTFPSRLVAFTSGPDPAPAGTVVFIPGLSDGPLALPYVPALGAAGAARGWALCQPVLSSSYLGFGTNSLAQDVLELDALLDGIDGRIVLIGHSTGCQDIVAYLRSGAGRGRVVAAVMQGAVSDRQAMGMEHGDAAVAAAAASATALVSRGQGEVLMPRDTPGVFDTPVSAVRYASLAGRLTADDMFSADLTDAELAVQLGHMAAGPIPAGGEGGDAQLQSRSPPSLMWAFSGCDEYVPTVVKETYSALGSRISAAAGGGGGSAESSSRCVVIEGGNHSLDGEPGTEFVKLVGDFLDQLPPLL